MRMSSELLLLTINPHPIPSPNPSQFPALCSTPRVLAQENDLIVKWKSEGDGRGVYGYHVQFRNENSGWKTYGQLVPYVRDNMEYTQTLTGLERGHAYFIHVQVLDRNSYVMYTSAQSSAKSSCSRKFLSCFYVGAIMRK